MTRGFLLGKFMPPHAGHVFLGRFAQAHCDDLTILVCTLDCDPIPGELRVAWMRELFPKARVIHHADDIPQEPTDHPDFWPIWRRAIRARHPEPIDFVFASEDYGHRLASELDARFVPVEMGRETFPVSGTAVRANPYSNWRFIPAPVRPYYAKTVCAFGPESTGKTTLCRDLARLYDTILVPEYGRIYTEAFGMNLTAADHVRIAEGHVAATAAAASSANRLLIADTDPVLTAVWSDMLTGSRDPYFDRFDAFADLYLLTSLDAPFVQDGTRYFAQDSERLDFFKRCAAELRRRNLPYVVVSGTPQARLAAADHAIRTAFPDVFA
jgi:HTH-type transcriptional regulator, transcriptional repressor of NAD biosynthesis genes